MTDTEFAILGAGAMGSILGAHLVRNGHSVVMLARDRRAEQLRADGLRVQGLAEFAVPVKVISDTRQFVSARILIVSMKTPGTAAALAALPRASIGAAFSVQNGLMKNELLSSALEFHRVLGALADTSGELLPTGEVLFTRNAKARQFRLSLPLLENFYHLAQGISAISAHPRNDDLSHRA